MISWILIHVSIAKNAFHDLLNFTSWGRRRLHRAKSMSSKWLMIRGNLLYIPLDILEYFHLFFSLMTFDEDLQTKVYIFPFSNTCCFPFSPSLSHLHQESITTYGVVVHVSSFSCSTKEKNWLIAHCSSSLEKYLIDIVSL